VKIDRNPPPPDALIGALQDPIHPPSGRLISSKTIDRESPTPRPEVSDIYCLPRINDLAADIYANAKSKGWWDDARSERSVRALIVSEHSETLEAFRDDEPHVWFKPPLDKALRSHWLGLASNGHKPLGLGMELVDGLIRALDWIGGNGHAFGAAEIKMMQVHREPPPDVISVPDQVDWLTEVLFKEGIWRGYVMAVLGIARVNGIDAWECIKIKHFYNKTRPHRHGGKRA
jgi:hypothetical protein